jgi:hypothetical protein
LKKIHKEREKGREKEEEGVSSYRMNLRNEKILKVETGSSIAVENSLWKRVWTCYKTDYLMMK